MDIKQELLNYFPNKDEARKILKDLGLSDQEIEERINCNLNEILIYETAHRIIDRLAGFSDRILDKFAKVLNVKDNRFSFKTEFLFKAVYFLRKKAYAQYIIEREGELIQELTQSGIGVKSDVPEMTNEMMKHLFKVIIYTNNDRNLILKAVDKWKDKFKKLIKERSVSICIPCGFNKDLSEYKTLNDCLRGMLFYNELMGQEIFKPGTKGFKIYIKGIDYTKLGMDTKQYYDLLKRFFEKYKIKTKKRLEDNVNRIVIPDDSEVIPDWIILDEDTILDKIFVSKANEVLEPLGIQVSLQTSQQLMELF